MSSMLWWFAGGFLLLTLLLLIRQAYSFVRWRQSLGRLEHYEWTRTLTSIRNHDE